MKDLITDNSVSRAQYDQAEAALRTAESGVESAQSQVALAQNRLGYTTLASDVAGVVTLAGPEPGEVVGAGRMIVGPRRARGRATPCSTFRRASRTRRRRIRASR